MMLPNNIVSLDDLEKWFTEITLVSLGGDKTKTAKQLGIDRRTLYRKLSQWGLTDKYRVVHRLQLPQQEGQHGDSIRVVK